MRDEGKDPCHLDRRWGATAGAVAYWLSVLEPVDVPQCWQRYSYRFPVGSTSSSRSRVGVATRQEGQESSEAFNDLNWSGCSEASDLGGRAVLGDRPVGHVGPVGLRGRPDIKSLHADRAVGVNAESLASRCSSIHHEALGPFFDGNLGACRNSFQTPRPACTRP